MNKLRLTLRSFMERRPGIGFLIIGLVIILTILFMAVFAPLVAPYNPVARSGERLTPPDSKHIMGTNYLGQDIFSRIVYGSRIILFVVFVATIISMSIGIPLGIFSGYKGGGVDRVLSVVMDSIYAFPALILAIAIAAVLGPSPMNTALSIAVVYVPTYFRMTRSQTLSLKSALFVEAAKSMGSKDSYIMRKHILPNLLPTIIVVFSLSVADAILTEAGLSYLGLSVTPPTPDWGFDLRMGQSFMTIGYWWVSVFPGLMVMLLATGFALVGESLSERIAIRTEPYSMTFSVTYCSRRDLMSLPLG
jgi:peptide/nickel transport system permease protein